MPSSQSDGPAVQWSRDTMDSRPEEEHAIRVLNNAFRSVSARKLSMVSVLDEDPAPSTTSSRYVSAAPLRDKPRGHGHRPGGTYQGTVSASLSDMLINGDFGNGSDSEEEEEEQQPPPRRRAHSRRASQAGSRAAGAEDPDRAHGHASLFGPPDPSLYSPGSDQQVPLPHMPAPPSNVRTASPHRASFDGRAQPAMEQSSLSQILDKFVAEEESGPIIRSKNYTGQSSRHGRGGPQDRSDSAPRRIASLASMDKSYASSRNSRDGRSHVDVGDEYELGAGGGEESGPGRRLLSGVSGSSASDAFAAASEAALSSMPRPPRAARPSLDAAASESWQSSCSAALGRRPVTLGVTSSMTDLHAPDAGGRDKLVVFSSVSALPPLGNAGGMAAGTPPRPRQLRAIGAAPATPPQAPPGERMLSRHTSPARGGGMVSRDASPSRPVPRLVGSRDASPTVTRPMAATEIVAAAVAQIAAAGHSLQSPPPRSRDSGGSVSSPTPSQPCDQVRSALRPPKPMQGAAAGAGAGARAPAHSSWDVALRDSSPSRPGARCAPDDPPLPPPQQQQRAAPLLRSRDNSPLRSLGPSAAVETDVDPETLAEMMSGNIAWRLPMRMGVATQNPARVSNAGGGGGGGRTSRDASPNSRGMRSLTEEPAVPAPPPAKPPKPLTKPPNWGRGGDPGRGHASGSHGGSGLGNTLPHLVQSHVFMEPGGSFDIVHGTGGERQ